MPCNWELFELRVTVWTPPAMKASGRGYAGAGVKFWSVSPDLRRFGIGGFQGHNNDCDFESVFKQLVQKRAIVFSCSSNGSNQSGFTRLKNAEQKLELLPAAKLYVHRRDESDIDSDLRGVGVLLERVQAHASTANGGYYIDLSAGAASPLNFGKR